MQYTLSWGWLLIGIIILAVGVVFVRFHQWIANNFGSGVASYERYRLYAFITCALGFIVMLNLHTFLLGSFFNMIFNH